METGFQKCSCPACGQHVAYPLETAGRKVTCPSCGGSIQLPLWALGHRDPPPANPFKRTSPVPSLTFTVQRRTKLSWRAGLLMGAGVLLLFWWPFGTVGGALLVIGVLLVSRKFVCSECEHPVADRSVKSCPTCHAKFGSS